METFDGNSAQSVASHLPEPRTMIKSRKNFIKNYVLKLIEGYRTVGICLQNKSRKRQKDFEPSLDISNFGLSSADLNTVF
jgi:2-oxoglutarate dehydrogenase E1 component